MFNHVGIGKDGYPVVLSSFWRLDPVHAEATGKASNTTKHRFERLAEVVRDEVLKYLNHADPTRALVRNLRLTAKTHDLRIFDHCRNHVGKTVGEDFGIGVNHEHHFIKVGRDSCDFPDAVEHFKLEFRHSFVKHDFLEEGHEDDLTVTLATIAWFRFFRFIWSATFYDENHWHALLFLGRDARVCAVVIKARIDFCHIMTFS